VKWLSLQWHPLPVLVQFPGLQVRFKDPEPNSAGMMVSVVHVENQLVSADSSTVAQLFQWASQASHLHRLLPIYLPAEEMNEQSM